MKIPVLLLLCICLLASCRRPKDPAPAPKTTHELLIGSWRITELYFAELDGVVVNQNEVDSYTPCRKDDFEVFTAEGRLVYNYGEDKCDTSEPQTADNIAWKLQDKTLWYYADGDSARYVIQEISETTLKLHFPLDQTGNTGNAYLTYKRL